MLQRKTFMRTLLLSFFSVLVTLKGLGQDVHNSNITVNIISCETSIIWRIRNDSLLIEMSDDLLPNQSKFALQVKILKEDLKKIDSAFVKLTSSPENEVLVNECIDDGFNFKMYLNDGNIKKKIFVGNYYDSRVDSLTKIITWYVKKSGLYLGNYGIGCDDDPERSVKSQERCHIILTESHRKSYLDRWCEIPVSFK